MNNADYRNHVKEEFLDYYSPRQERIRKRAIDYVNSKPVISKGLKRLLAVVFSAIGVAVLIKWVG